MEEAILYWGGVLTSSGFTGTSERRGVIAAVLFDNGLSKQSQLRFTNQPGEWLDAEKLEVSEIAFLDGLRSKKCLCIR